MLSLFWTIIVMFVGLILFLFCGGTILVTRYNERYLYRSITQIEMFRKLFFILALVGVGLVVFGMFSLADYSNEKIPDLGV